MERRQHAVFRFDPRAHAYYDLEGRTLPHITGMLKAGGWVDDTWFTEESSIRGTAVHDLTAEYDLEALDHEQVVSRYRSWLLAYVECMKRLRPEWKMIEEPIVHPVYRFGGRPDAIGVIFNRWTVLEKKTAAKRRVTNRGLTLDPVGIQTALQTILAATIYPLPLTSWDRRAVYLKENGKFSLEPYTDERDFDEAWRLIRDFGGKPNGEAAIPLARPESIVRPSAAAAEHAALPAHGGRRKPARTHAKVSSARGAAWRAVNA